MGSIRTSAGKKETIPYREISITMGLAIPRFHCILFVMTVNYGAETFMNFCRAFVGNSVTRYDILGSRAAKWKDLLLRKIPPDQLSPNYGGANPYWKPLPLL